MESEKFAAENWSPVISTRTCACYCYCILFLSYSFHD